MRTEIDGVFASTPPERSRTDKDEFRYEMFNRSAGVPGRGREPGDPARSIEPLLGDDCHVIANTAWRNPPDFAGGPWHCDAGPHVPRPEGVPWDDRIPYPVFAVATHVYLQDCTRADGPTAVVPGSHRSGRLAPFDRMHDEDLTYDGRPPGAVRGRGRRCRACSSRTRGTAAFPRGPGGRGRYFLQVHYARRDIAQRVRTTDGREPGLARGRSAGDDRAASAPSSGCTPRSSTTASSQMSSGQLSVMPSTSSVRPRPRNTAQHNVRSRISSSAKCGAQAREQLVVDVAVIGGEPFGVLDREPLAIGVAGPRFATRRGVRTRLRSRPLRPPTARGTSSTRRTR